MDESHRLDATFMALADPTRRAILARLALGEASVAELAAPFEISQPAISKHLKILERAQLVSVGMDAQRRPRKIDAKPLAEAHAWIERYREIWEASFERLDMLLAELQSGEPTGRERAVRGPGARKTAGRATAGRNTAARKTAGRGTAGRARKNKSKRKSRGDRA